MFIHGKSPNILICPCTLDMQALGRHLSQSTQANGGPIFSRKQAWNGTSVHVWWSHVKKRGKDWCTLCAGSVTWHKTAGFSSKILRRNNFHEWTNSPTLPSFSISNGWTKDIRHILYLQTMFLLAQETRDVITQQDGIPSSELQLLIRGSQTIRRPE